jgi:hypothetical protein
MILVFLVHLKFDDISGGELFVEIKLSFPFWVQCYIKGFCSTEDFPI